MSPLYIEGMPLETAISKNESRLNDEFTAEKRQDERTFYLLFVLSFPLFLVVVLAGRMMPGVASGDRTENNAGKSIIAEASAKTRSTIASAWTG